MYACIIGMNEEEQNEDLFLFQWHHKIELFLLSINEKKNMKHWSGKNTPHSNEKFLLKANTQHKRKENDREKVKEKDMKKSLSQE